MVTIGRSAAAAASEDDDEDDLSPSATFFSPTAATAAPAAPATVIGAAAVAVSTLAPHSTFTAPLFTSEERTKIVKAIMPWKPSPVTVLPISRVYMT